MKHPFLIFAVGSLCWSQAIPLRATDTEKFTIKPSESVLLLDDHTVARTKNLTQHFFPAQKHPANPVMRRTEKWEGVGPYLWGNRLMQDEKSGELRMWYIAFDYTGNFYRWGYATSKDAIHWTKPDLGIERFGNTLAKNLLPLGPHPEKGTRSIARDPRPETPSHRRYLGVRFTYQGELVSFSPDGIAWLEYPMNPAWHVPSDIIHIMWDERRNCFTAYYKLWEVSGTLVQTNNSDPEKPFVAYMPTYDMTNQNNGTTSFGGPMIHFHTDGAAEVKRTNFVLRAQNQGKDDGGGTSLSGAWTAKRVQAWAQSDDGIHWKNEQVILRADKQDPATANIQFMFVMPYGGYYLGFLTMHDEAGHFRIQLAWSGDGLHWNRPWRKPWLDVGTGEAFDRGMVLGPADPILWEREMWFPYGGFPIRHDSPETNWESAIGLATTRLDGFAAWQAGAETGELLTQPFRCNGDRLFVNADVQSGSLQVEVLDEKGKPIKGFESKSSRPITADTLVKESDGWMQWKAKKNLQSVQGKLIQLRFTLKNARLYSFRVADEQTTKLPVPRATQR
jgi:hypothetical protein